MPPIQLNVREIESLNDDEKKKAISKARFWLSAVQNGWKACFDADPQKNRSQVHEEMTKWLNDPYLTKVQDEKFLANFSQQEQENWKKLWSEVKVLRDRSVTNEQEAIEKEE